MTVDDLQRALDGCPAAQALGLRVLEADVAAHRLVLAMPMTANAERAAGSGQFHGGAIASLIDTAGDYAVALGVGGGVPTINFRVDYLRPASGARLKAVASARRIGRTVAVADVEVLDEEGRVCALGRCTYASNPG